MADPSIRAEHNKRQSDRLANPSIRAEHNKRQSDRLANPSIRAEHNKRQSDRLANPSIRAEHNKRQSDRLANPSIRNKHNRLVLEKYKTSRRNVNSVSLHYFSQISEGPTYVCSCCGCLHFRKSVVILTRARLDSMGDQTIIDQVCYLSL